MRKIILALALSCAAACTTNGAHNDVLLFGTDTKIGFDVGANATNAGVPELTLGYKRREAVWMPMVVNGSSSAVMANANQTILNTLNACVERTARDNAAQLACYTAAGDQMAALREAGGAMPPTDAMYRGTTEGVQMNPGESRKETDTYSVFASFGGDFSGASGGRAALAQFFATGIAAQRLGENPRIDMALSVQSGERQANDALRGALDQVGEQNRALGAAAIDAAASKSANRLDLIVSCLSLPAHRADRTAAIDTVKTSNPDLKSYLEDPISAQMLQSDDGLHDLLVNNDALANALAGTTQVTACGA